MIIPRLKPGVYLKVEFVINLTSGMSPQDILLVLFPAQTTSGSSLAEPSVDVEPRGD